MQYVLFCSIADRWREIERHSKLKMLLSDVMVKTLDRLNCMLLLTDSYYQPLFSNDLYGRFHDVPYFKVKEKV